MSAARHEALRPREDDAAGADDTLLDFAPAVGVPTLAVERRLRATRREGDRRVGPGSERGPGESEADLGARLLGPFALQVRGVAVRDWPTSRAKSLLKFLLLHRGRAVARPSVLDTFWPDIEPEAARNNLHVAIHRLRRLLQAYGLGADTVRCADGLVGLQPGLSVWLDTEQFDAAFDTAQALPAGAEKERALSAALALVRGEIVAADRGEAWIEPFRHHVVDRQLLGWQALAQARLAAGDEPACIAHAQRMLALDACSEEAHRLLMRSYGRLAQPARVERQYRACVQALRSALGVAPHAETTALYRELFGETRSN